MKKKVYDVQILDGTRISIKEDASFFTTDTNAVLVFNVVDQAIVPTAATITLVNTNDKSVVNVEMNLNVKEASYTIPANVIEHAGSWVVQVIFEYAGKDYTVPAVRVPVTGHILDGKEPRLFAVESFENLMKSLEAMKDSLAGEVGGVQTSIDDIRADLQSRADTLIDEQGTRLSDLYTEKDATLSGLVDEYASKAETLEADYATELARLGQSDLSLTAQLHQTEQSLNAQLAQAEMFSGQADFVEMIKNRTKYSHMSAKKINAPYEALQVFCHNGNEHVTHEWKKNNNDDFWTYNVAYGGKITTSPEYLKSTDIKTGTWSSIDGSGNVYTTEVGANFTVHINGSTLQLNHMADSRGGIFRVVIDEDEANAVIVSTYNDTTVVKNTIIATGLSNGLHTVVGTFMGADPNHTPTATARGWIRDDQTSPVSTDRYTMVGGLPFNGIYSSTVNRMLLGYGSNKEFAFNMTKNSETHWFPEHNSQGTAFKISEVALIIDNQEINFQNMEYNKLYSGVNLSFTQEVQCIFPNIANPLANMLISYEVGIDGVLSISGKMTFEQDVLVNNGYSLMMPLAWTTNNYVLDELVTSIGTVSKNKGDSSNEHFVTESDRTYSFASIGGANKDYIAAMSIDYPTKTYRFGKEGRGNPFIFFNHRPAYPKLYPLTMFAHNAKAGDVYQFYGRFAVGKIKRVYDLIK